MKRIEVYMPASRLVEVVAIDHRPIMVGDYVIRREVYDSLGADGRYVYEGIRCKASFDGMDNRVGRSALNPKDAWAIGHENERILEKCVAIRFADDRINDYFGVIKI